MDSLRGKILLAGVDMLDPNFAQTIVLIVQHDEDGALGLVLNRPSETTIAEAWEQVCVSPCLQPGVLYQGGPCEGPLMLLHGYEELAQIRVMQGVHFTAESDHVTWLMEHNDQSIKACVGYAGWGPGQLEDEADSQSWLFTPASPQIVFADSDRQWLNLLRRVNPTQAALLQRPELLPEDPSMN